MKIRVLAVGKRMPDWVEAGSTEFERRLPRELSIEWRDITPVDRKTRSDAGQIKALEADRILACVTKDDWVVALDEGGRLIDTLGWSAALKDWQMEGRKPTFIIGGADGLDERCLQRAQVVWSLSRLTFPHPLVRVILAEQLYRAAMVNANHPYHRE